MIDARFHHVGIAVRSLDDAAAALRVAGLRLASELPDTVDAGFGVRLRFLQSPHGGPFVELVEGLDTLSPVAGVLKRTGPGPYHLCLSVPNLEAARTELEAAAYRAVTPPMHAVAFSGALVQFFLHAACGLVELVEFVELGVPCHPPSREASDDRSA